MTQSDVRHGVTVYDYRQSEPQPAIEIPADVAASLMAQHSADWCERLSEELRRPHIAQWATEMAAKPRTDEHIADAVSTVVFLSADELAEFARQLVSASESQCDKLIDACIAAFELQPQRQRATELAAVVEAERRRTFVVELRTAINAVIDGVLRRTQ